MVVWTVPVRNDLKNIHDFIARDSAHYAKKVVTDILERSGSLEDLPRIGRVVPEIGHEQIREVPVHAYRLMYQIMDAHIYILALVHKRREFSETDLQII